MDDCIFCKIGKKEIPCHKVYEDNDFLAFLDVNPLNPGHTLIIPKNHKRWVWDVDNCGEYFELAKKLALAIKKAFNTDYVVSMVMGHEVPHAHIHVIPRHEGDGHGGGIKLDNVHKLSDEQMKEAVDKIVKNL